MARSDGRKAWFRRRPDSNSPREASGLTITTETLGAFTEAGVTRVEMVPYPNTMETLEFLEPVLTALT